MSSAGLPEFQNLEVRQAPDQIEAEVMAKIEAVKKGMSVK